MKITIEREKCIGCGTCASLCEKFFELAEDGKSHLKGAKKDPKKEELEIKEEGCAKEAVEACPVECIKIIN